MEQVNMSKEKPNQEHTNKRTQKICSFRDIWLFWFNELDDIADEKYHQNRHELCKEPDCREAQKSTPISLNESSHDAGRFASFMSSVDLVSPFRFEYFKQIQAVVTFLHKD